MASKKSPYLLIFPALLLTIFTLGLGIVYCFIQSLGYFPMVGLETFSLQYYLTLFQDKVFLNSLFFSLYTSVVATAITVVIGVYISYAFLSVKEKTFQKYIHRLPVLIPHVIVSLMAIFFLTQSGLLSRVIALFMPGFEMTSFPELIYDQWGIGIIIANVWKSVPFVFSVLYGVLVNIDNKYTKVAYNLGAKKRQVFFNIILPLSLPFILTNCIIIFSFIFGSFEIPFLLGPATPKTLPVLAYEYYQNINLVNRPYAMAINGVLIIVSLILIYFFSKAYKRGEKINE